MRSFLSRFLLLFFLFQIFQTSLFISPTHAAPANHILISEVVYDPSGNENEAEWFELFNPTSATVSLSGWTIKEGGTPFYTFQSGASIQAAGYLVVGNQNSDFQLENTGSTLDIDMQKIDSPSCNSDSECLLLNNTSPGDSLTLKDNLGTTIDFVAWEAPSWTSVIGSNGKSISRISSTDTDTATDWLSETDFSPKIGTYIFTPFITLKGLNTLTIQRGSSYSDAGAIFTSFTGTGNLTATGFVNSSVVGTYSLNYTYTDSLGNVATLIVRTVNVVDTLPPSITINQSSGQSDPSSSSPVSFTVVFSEAINPTTFNTGSISLSGTASGKVIESITQTAPNNGTTFEIIVSVTGSGTIIPSISASIYTVSGTYSVAGSPYGLAIDNSGNIYTTSYGMSTVTKLSSTGTLLGTYPVGANPYSMILDSVGNIYVANTNGNSVTKLSSNGTLLGTYPVGFNPYSITLDSVGNIYTANVSANSVTKLSPTGVLLGTYPVGFNPYSITLDSVGNVYTANVSANSVTKLSPTGALLGTYPVGLAPYSIAVDSVGNIYTASSSSNTVTKLSPTGVLLGTYPVGLNPYSIKVDSYDDIYVANVNSNNIIKFSSTGTLLGTYPVASPYTLGFDGNKNIYTTNVGTARVNRLSLTGPRDLAGNGNTISTSTDNTILYQPIVLNTPPIAVDQNTTVIEDTPQFIDLLAGSSDIDSNDIITLSQIVTAPIHGIISDLGEYTPNKDYCGNDEFRFQLQDNFEAISNVAIGYITVKCIEDNPIAVRDIYYGNEDALIIDTVGQNDIFPDLLYDVSATVSEFIIEQFPSFGTIDFNSQIGSFEYLPNPGFCSDLVVNTGSCNSTTIKVSVDDPQYRNLVGFYDAINRTYYSQGGQPYEDSSIQIRLEDESSMQSYIAGDPILAENLSYSYDPDTRIVTFTYIGSGSPQDWNIGMGEDIYQVTKTFTSCSNSTNFPTDTTSTTVEVSHFYGIYDSIDQVFYPFSGNRARSVEITDEGLIQSWLDTTIMSTDFSYYYDNNLNVGVFDYLGSEPNTSSIWIGDESSYSDKKQIDGLYVGNGSQTPTYIGGDSFTYFIADTRGLKSNTTTVNLGVACDNDVPVGLDDSLEIVEDSSGSVDILVNDSDSDVGDTIQLSSIVTQTSNGLSILNNGIITYTPQENYCGTDKLQYRIQDQLGALSSVTTLRITISCADDIPYNLTLSGTQLQENVSLGALVGLLGASDVDSSNLTYQLVSGSGDTNNAGFTLSGNQLLTLISGDYESQTTYSIRIAALDSSGGKVEQIFIIQIGDIDDIAPVISLVGSELISLPIGTPFMDPGAIWIDNVDGSGILTGSGIVNINILGDYTLNYNYTDTSSNSGNQVSRTVRIVSGDIPTINLLGNSVVTQQVGTAYRDAGANWIDGEDGSGSLLASGSVDTNTIGTYILTYNKTDISGNIATQVTRTVNVIDTIIPLITLLGTTNTMLEVGSSYSDAGVIATDNMNGNISSNVIISGLPIDTSTLGIKTITYRVSDSSGNPAIQVIRTVNIVDTTQPIIVNLNPITQTIQRNTNPTFLPVSCSDNYDVTCTIIQTGTVDTTQTGNYTITYTATDSSGNMSTTSIVIQVIPSSRGGGGNRDNTDICPNGDLSGNLYDRLCSAQVQEILSTPLETLKQTPIKEIPLIEISQENIDKEIENADTEIEALVSEIFGPLKKVTPEGISYTLQKNYDSCKTIDALSTPDYQIQRNLFQDISEEQIDLFGTLGIIQGTLQGNFEPEREITRAEFMKLVLLTHCYSYENQAETGNIYTDLEKGSWQSKVVYKAQEIGIISGYPDKTFRPDQSITKAEATKILMRMSLVDVSELGIMRYEDISSGWQKKYVLIGETLGIFDPQKDNNMFNPERAITRKNMLLMIQEIVSLYR